MAKGLLEGVLEPIVGGNTDDEDAAAREALEKAIGTYDSLKPPDLQPLTLDNYDWLGDFQAPATMTAPSISAGEDVAYNAVDPRLAELSLMGSSAMNDISVDPRLENSQMGALAALEEVVRSGGMTTADEAALGRVQSQVAQADRGRRDAIRQGMAARGMGGSGMELLSMLDSSQAATDRASQAGLDIAGMAEQRALDAMMQGGQLAGSIRGQDFGEQAQIAAANDAIAQFNAANSNNMSQFNTGTWNDMARFNAGNTLQTAMYNKDNRLNTQMFNVGNQMTANQFNAGAANDAAFYNHQGRQGTANANTDTKNKQTMHNNYQLPMTQFEANKAIADGKAGVYGKESDYWGKMGDREAAEAGAMTSGLFTIGAGGLAGRGRG